MAHPLKKLDISLLSSKHSSSNEFEFLSQRFQEITQNNVIPLRSIFTQFASPTPESAHLPPLSADELETSLNRLNSFISEIKNF